ncbi:MAG: NfeD family protein [Acidobacteria bacterium]|nr:NfeD family protein [Acidobacteriota bacterium]
MAWWIWILIALVLLAIEWLTTTFHPGFFAFGAIAVGILVAAGFGGPLWMQLIVFALVSMIFMLIFRQPLREKLGLEGMSKEIESIASEKGIALETIAPGATGKIEIRGTSWNGRNEGDLEIGAGDRCSIDRIEGLTLVIFPSIDKQ